MVLDHFNRPPRHGGGTNGVGGQRNLNAGSSGDSSRGQASGSRSSEPWLSPFQPFSGGRPSSYQPKSAGVPPSGEALHRVMVKRVPYEANTAALSRTMSAFGEVADVWLAPNKGASKARAVLRATAALVRWLRTAEAAARALANGSVQVLGKPITVQSYQERGGGVSSRIEQRRRSSTGSAPTSAWMGRGTALPGAAATTAVCSGVLHGNHCAWSCRSVEGGA